MQWMGCGEAADSARAYLGLPYVAGLAVHRDLAWDKVLRRLPPEYGSDADLVVGVGLQDLPRLRKGRYGVRTGRATHSA